MNCYKALCIVIFDTVYLYSIFHKSFEVPKHFLTKQQKIQHMTPIGSFHIDRMADQVTELCQFLPQLRVIQIP